MTQKSIEVETRFYFKDDAEAYASIPFLKKSLTSTNQWETHHLGIDLFKTDQVLRVGKNLRNNTVSQSYLGWKGRDQGTFANIREEMDEEITSGITDSAILTLLGTKSSQPTPEAVIQELNQLGHHLFMSFSGQNSLGYDETEDLHLKLMHCQKLEWPVLVEIEKTARDFDEALKRQQELLGITEKLQLQERVIRKEPPTLLFETIKKP